MRFFIDQDVCLPVRTEFFAQNGQLRKELVAERDEIKKVDEHWLPFHSTMIDHKLGRKSIFMVDEIEIDPDLDSGMFEEQALRRGGH